MYKKNTLALKKTVHMFLNVMNKACEVAVRVNMSVGEQITVFSEVAPC